MPSYRDPPNLDDVDFVKPGVDHVVGRLKAERPDDWEALKKIAQLVAQGAEVPDIKGKGFFVGLFIREYLNEQDPQYNQAHVSNFIHNVINVVKSEAVCQQSDNHGKI